MMGMIEKPLNELMEQAFLDYAMSVITDRALPDVRDGLKPVHRRVLFAMHEAGNVASRAYKKSARMVGDVIGKYHPHGDQSVYDAAVRMAQDFSLAYLLIDGQGNFGSVDGDNAAAMRYTEMRLTRLAGSMFDDIGKNTVEFRANYDGSEHEPTVLPVPFPNLLANGVGGIAVGMATSIPPHNLRSLVQCIKLLCVNADASVAEIVSTLQAPDFPTGGIVYGLEGMVDAIETGSGRVRLRAKWHAEDRKRGGSILVIDELPYQVNKADLVSKIAELWREKQFEDVSGLRDESNKDGTRIAIDLKPGASPEAVFAQIATQTNLDVSVSYNCVVLDGGIPKTMGIRRMLLSWIAFRKEVILKRFLFDRAQAQARLHILAGYMAAIAKLDDVIALIRSAPSSDVARSGLVALLGLDEGQAQAILDLRLQRLTGMELDAISAEHAEITARILEFTKIIESPERIQSIMFDELDAVSSKFGRDRRTEIGSGLASIDREDLVPSEDVILITTRKGYIKRVSATALDAQNRGTRGKRSMELVEGDEIAAIHQCHSHDLLLVFVESGQVYGCKAWRIPDTGLAGKARHIKNVIEGLDEEIRCMVTVPSNDPAASVVTVTALGQVKRSLIEDYTGAVRKGGIKGLGIDEGDMLLAAFAVRPHAHMMLVSSAGHAIRFDVEDVRVVGRIGSGVRGIKLAGLDRVIGAYSIASDGNPLPMMTEMDEANNPVERPDTRAMDAGKYLLCLGANGVGKRTSVSEFPLQSRAGKGVIAFRESQKTGPLVAAIGTSDDMDLVLMASNGVSNRIRVADVREAGRATSGVHLMNLDKGQTLQMAVVAPAQDDVVGDAAGASGDAAAPTDAVSPDSPQGQ